MSLLYHERNGGEEGVIVLSNHCGRKRQWHPSPW